jgi:tetratricopeptide (TPR) repeat protein
MHNSLYPLAISRIRNALLTALCVILPAMACAAQTEPTATPPSIPETPDLRRYETTPAPWRDYLLQARAAERIADPLQRCLAFPDLPGNQWPAGHAAAHCRYHFAVKRPTLDEIADLVERGEMGELERMFNQSLARHFSKDDFGDDIHDTFNYLLTRADDLESVDHITAAWLEKAPKSAYANLARGAYFNGAAWKARGAKYASETPKANLRRMSELVGQAIPYFKKAISINPRLMPAYTGMIDMGRLDSRSELAARGIREAKKLDPACPELSNQIMLSLEPRWGGSYEQMLAYSNEISGMVAQWPQLAVYMAKPFADRGNRLRAGGQYTKESLEVLEVSISIGSDEPSLHDAANVVLNLTDGTRDDYKAVSYLLQEARFAGINAWGMRNIAWTLVRLEPEWSLKYSLQAIQKEPENALAHYLAGAGYYNTKQYDDADREYNIAIENGEWRQSSLREVSEMWLWKGDTQDADVRKANAIRAKPYIDRLVREYPDDGRGAIMAIRVSQFETDLIMLDPLREAMKKIDRSDPWQARQTEDFDHILKQFDEKMKQIPKPKP